MSDRTTDERTDLGYRLARLVCRIIGHRWRPWTRNRRRCKRCLKWEGADP